MAVADDLDRMLARERMLAASSSALGGVSVLLAAIGVFGLAAQTVRARTREIGLRMALGASQCRVWRSEILSALWFCTAGMAVGIPLAVGAGRLIRAELFGVSPEDPVTLGVMSALLVTLALAASLLPATWAARVNPSIALRCE